jgi:hypothetical protein
MILDCVEVTRNWLMRSIFGRKGEVRGDGNKYIMKSFII